jgi:hypothetical protein
MAEDQRGSRFSRGMHVGSCQAVRRIELERGHPMMVAASRSGLPQFPISSSGHEEHHERGDDDDGYEERRDERRDEKRHAEERKERRVGREQVSG